MSRGSELFRDATGTQGEKARKLGLAQQYVSQLYNGKRTPGDELKAKIEKTFGVPKAMWDEATSEATSEDAPNAGAGPRGDDPAGPLIPDAPVAEQARAVLRWLVSKTALTTEQKNLVGELRQVMAMEAKSSPLEAHPDFTPWLDGLLDALQGVPGALDALDAHLAKGAPARKAA